MTNINQLSQLLQTGNVLSDISNDTKKADGSEFLKLLKEIREKNLNIDNTDKNSKISLDTLGTNNKASFTGGTEAFLSNLGNVKKDNFLYDSIDVVNNAQIKSEKSAAAFAAGYGDELQMVLDVSKAEKYLQFFSEVRVKFVNAVKELTRTQI
jgi:flagellar hook-basal body complex protein FliE